MWLDMQKWLPDSAEKYNKSLAQIYAAGAYLNNKRENEVIGLKECGPYIVQEFSYLEFMLEALHLEVSRLKSAEMEREWFVVEWEPGEYKLFDFETGRKKDIKVISKDEYAEYINRRAGIKIY